MRLFAVGVLLGLVSGWWFTADHYRSKIERTELAQQKAEIKRNEDISKLATHWQSELDAANDREPDVITERVFVKARCVPATGSDTVDDGAATTRAELAERTVRNLRALAKEKEQQYRECSHRLRAWQDALTD